jgi:hypothetical protein
MLRKRSLLEARVRENDGNCHHAQKISTICCVKRVLTTSLSCVNAGFVPVLL